MTTSTDALPMPSMVDVEVQTTQVAQNWRTGGMLRLREIDAANRPRRWTLRYERAHGAVADAIRQHFAAFHSQDFDWTPPGASDAVRVVHREPPAINWDNVASASAAVYLEEVLAHD